MTDKPITRLQDARHLKQAGLPLNTPAEDQIFSSKYTEHWVDLMNAHATFMLAMGEYSDTQRPGKWKLAKRRLAALDKATERCVVFVAELAGNIAAGADPVFESEQDGHEYSLMLAFITERALPFINYWTDAIDAVDVGTALTIRPGDVPSWLEVSEPE